MGRLRPQANRSPDGPLEEGFRSCFGYARGRPAPAASRARFSSLTQAGASTVEADALPRRARVRLDLTLAEVVIASRGRAVAWRGRAKFAGGNLADVHSDRRGHFALSLAAVPAGSWKVTILTSPKSLSAHSSCAGASKATTLII